MLVDLGDHTQRPVFFQGEWEVGTTRLLQQYAFPAWTFVDIGANAGYFTLLACDLGGPDTKVLSFEPAPRVRHLLQANVILNGEERNIAVRPEACGGHVGVATLSLSPNTNSGRSTLGSDLEVVAGTAEVAVTTLDGVCEALSLRPDVIKVDVEGYEPQVLAGMTRILGEQIPKLVVVEVSSYAGRPHTSSVEASMLAHGYVARHINDDGTLTSPTVLGSSEFKNVAFIRA